MGKERLKFSCVSLANEHMLTGQKDFSFHRDYNWWIQVSCNPYAPPTIINTSGTSSGLKAKEEAEIVPVLRIPNLSKTYYHPGDRFFFRELQFKILEPNYAICLSSIGKRPFCDIDSENYSDTCYYNKSTLKEELEEWFETFFSDEPGVLCRKIPPLDALYSISKVTESGIRGTTGDLIPPGRYIVLNNAMKVVQSAGKFGYKSYESARNAMRHWSNVYPIPQEDINAFYDSELIW